MFRVLIFGAVRLADRRGGRDELIMQPAQVGACRAVLGPDGSEPFRGSAARTVADVERVGVRRQREQFPDRPPDGIGHGLDGVIVKHRWPPP